MKTQHGNVENAIRRVAITVAVLFIGLSIVGILGIWMVESRANEIAQKGFGLVETAVGLVDAGMSRVDDLIATSRTEVRQATETITAAGARAEANRPVLQALSERLETRLTPRIAQMKQALAPVRDAVGTIGTAVSVVNSLPMMADRAPRLAALDQAFLRLEELSADTTQLQSTLRALVAAQTSDVPVETVATLNALAQRIDKRLGEVQASVHEVRTDVSALQVRLDSRKARMLFAFKLLATLATLMLAWTLYSQIVVIGHYRK